MTDFVKRLARRGCTVGTGHKGDGEYYNASCTCDAVASVLRDALEEVEKMVSDHATRIAEADKGKQWPTKETAGDVGLLVSLACEISALRGEG